jgi:hypothetical protein
MSVPSFLSDAILRQRESKKGSRGSWEKEKDFHQQGEILRIPFMILFEPESSSG